KMMHTSYMPKGKDFNVSAGVGSPIYEKLRELRCPFYIDRFQGGCALPRRYRFDPDLIGSYKAMLGDNFWGWQAHEWASNYRSDVKRIFELYKKLGVPSPTAKERKAIWEKIKSGEEKLFLEALAPEEWAAGREPQNRAMFIDDICRLYSMISEMTDSKLIPADSYQMAPRIEIENGAKLLLPEIGWQIPNMRIQLAYTRGMARAAKIRWGVYYECWCHNSAVGSLTYPFSLREGQDEWFEDQLTRGSGSDRSPKEREQGGTSRNLQERAWRFAYLSGATVIGEEYGVSNTFRDYKDLDLSPYGKTKREFLRFTERFTDVGEPFTPIAVVLPEALPVLNVDLPEDYLGYPSTDVSDGADSKIWQNIRAVLPLIFGKRGKLGNNAHVLTPGGLPDAFDILHEGDETALGRYQYFIDLTGGVKFAKTHRVITPEEADDILTRLLPFRLEGEVHTLYRKTADGWLVFASNNDGVLCDNFKGDVRLGEAFLTSRIDYRSSGASCRILDGSGVLKRDDAGDFLELRAGDWVLLGVSEA
nr:hypothetical protein [Clostridiales bacterium]